MGLLIILLDAREHETVVEYHRFRTYFQVFPKAKKKRGKRPYLLLSSSAPNVLLTLARQRIACRMVLASSWLCLQKLVQFPARCIEGVFCILRMDMAAKRSACFIDIPTEVFLRWDVVFLMQTDVPDDFATEQPQVVHMVPDCLLFQALIDHGDHKRTHDVENAFSVRHVLFEPVPAIRPLRKVGTDIFGSLHIFLWPTLRITWTKSDSFLDQS